MTSEEMLIRNAEWDFRVNVRKSDDSGYLYILKCRKTGFCKIGKSRNASVRLQQIRSHYPNEIEAQFVFPVCDRHKAEKYFHSRYGKKRMYGEWFALTDSDLAWIDSICNWDGLGAA